MIRGSSFSSDSETKKTYSKGPSGKEEGAWKRQMLRVGE